MIRVELTPDEQVFAWEVSGQRRHSAMLRERWQRMRTEAQDAQLWAVDLLGVGGEMAVAKALGRYWIPSITYAGRQVPDIAPDIQVRSTEYRTGHLPLHPGDPPEHFYYLALGKFPVYMVVGSIRGREGMQQEFWADPVGGAPAYFVPQRALNPIGGSKNGTPARP